MISVAMATYNGEKFLKEQLDSIFSQTMPIDELVICDDCSKDKTIEIIQSYQKRYPIKLFQNEKKQWIIVLETLFFYVIKMTFG